MEPTMTTRLEAEGLAFAVETFLKEKPFVNYQADGTVDVYFSNDQVPRLQAKIQELVARKSTVRVHAAPVVVPILAKKLWPVVLGIVVVGFLVGRISRKRR